MRPTLLVISLLVISTTCLAQDTIKVVVEEIRIPVTAKDSTGRFDPTVQINDPRGYVIINGSTAQ